MMKSTLLGLAFVCLTTQLASADLKVTFDEGAPKDRFTFQNESSCAIRSSILTLDLSGSAAGLIFDVTASGAGVQVFQPLEMVSGEEFLAEIPSVKDGDNVVSFQLTEFPARSRLSFTIDVDDTKGGREITVADSEIEGATVLLSDGVKTVEQAFGSDAQLVIKTNPCA